MFFCKNLLLLNKYYNGLDLPYSGQASFQEPASNIMEYIIDVHHEIFFYLIIVIVFVFWWLFTIVYKFSSSFYFWSVRFILIPNFFSYRGLLTKTKNTFVNFILGNLVLTSWTKIDNIKSAHWEFWWTVIPTIFLTLIAIPSLFLIYNLDKYPNSMSNINYLVKVIGCQWYWVYEYTNFRSENISISSIMLSFSDLLKIGQGYRLLDVDYRLFLLEGQYWQFLVSSNDVIHSWSVPSLGLKIDACPGRLNRTFARSWRVGVFYGQCSEICGIYHGFMPVVVEVIDIYKFLNSLYLNKNAFNY